MKSQITLSTLVTELETLRKNPPQWRTEAFSHLQGELYYWFDGEVKRISREELYKKATVADLILWFNFSNRSSYEWRTISRHGRLHKEMSSYGWELEPEELRGLKLLYYEVRHWDKALRLEADLKNRARSLIHSCSQSPEILKRESLVPLLQCATTTLSFRFDFEAVKKDILELAMETLNRMQAAKDSNIK